MENLVGKFCCEDLYYVVFCFYAKLNIFCDLVSYAPKAISIIELYAILNYLKYQNYVFLIIS